MRSISTGGIFVLFCISCWSCTSEKAPAPKDKGLSCDTVNVSSARIYAIIQANCTNYACHPGGGSPVKADFSSVARLKSYIGTYGSEFQLRVTGLNADMPQSQGFPPLSRATRDSIACWIGKGMPD